MGIEGAKPNKSKKKTKQFFSRVRLKYEAVESFGDNGIGDYYCLFHIWSIISEPTIEQTGRCPVETSFSYCMAIATCYHMTSLRNQIKYTFFYLVLGRTFGGIILISDHSRRCFVPSLSPALKHPSTKNLQNAVETRAIPISFISSLGRGESNSAGLSNLHSKR